MNEYNLQAGSFDENCWSDLIDYGNLLDDAIPPADLYCDHQLPSQSNVLAIEGPVSRAALQASECVEEQECQRKRGRNDQCAGGTKACRERMRREKLNERFLELSAILEPGRPMKIEKSSLIGDAIRVLNQLKAESQEYRVTNEKLLEEIKTLKAEKNELGEEKLVLKAIKEKIEQQLKTTGLLPAHPASNKMPVYPGYSYVPMWHYLPPSACDTSQDHNLRPPAA